MVIHVTVPFINCNLTKLVKSQKAHFICAQVQNDLNLPYTDLIIYSA